MSFNSAERQLEEAIMERAMWLATSAEHKEETINTLVNRNYREGIEKSDPFYNMTMVSRLKNAINTPDDYRKRKA